jgi:asparagine synthase (glutamine-hydrolysing)
VGPVAPPLLRQTWWRLRAGGPPWGSLIQQDFARRVGLADRVHTASVVPREPALDGARREHWRQLTSGRLASTLETLAVAAGAAGVEPCDPFLDRRVMEFCLALPAPQKIRSGQTRLVARHGLRDVLPPEIRDRKGKAPIDLMLGAALATYGQERLGRLMDDACAVLAPYVVPAAIRRMHERYLERRALADVLRVWSLATLTLWLRRAAV